MDIAALSIIKNQAQLSQNVGIAVLKKVMDTAGQDVDLVQQMMNQVNAPAESLLPYLGGNIDIYV